MLKYVFLFLALVVSFTWWYSFVFSNSIIFGEEIEYIGEFSSQVYLNDQDLSKTVVVYKSNTDISDYSVYSSCYAMKSSFLEQYKNLYFFELDFSNASTCKNGNIVLEHYGVKQVQTMSELEFVRELDMLWYLLDFSDIDLELYRGGLEIDMKKYSIYANYNDTLRTDDDIEGYYRNTIGQRKYQEAVYEKGIVSGILTARKQKYLVPVAGKQMPHAHTRLPNASRWYRASYTDGIHHGWDIYGLHGEELIALDDGIIVRVEDNFEDSDLSKIQYGSGLSEFTELKNLDLLRGKQVWLKTMKGEVVFYSHLASIPSEIEEWMKVSRGDVVWYMWLTGVPGGTAYSDYHLHFSIMENPYRIEDAGGYIFDDYMKWNWKFHDFEIWAIWVAQDTVFE